MTQIKRLAIFLASFFLIVSAAVVNVPNLYYMSALLLALPWVSYLMGMVSLRDLHFSRTVPGTGWAGETARFTLIVRSTSRLPRFGLEAQDHLPRWMEHIGPSVVTLNAAPGGETRAEYDVHLLKRGAFRLDGFTVTALDPLGIFSFSKKVPAEGEMLVYPTPETITDLLDSGSEKYGFRDLPIAATRGSGVDPDGVREYVPGDPLHRVHWKAVARTGRMNVIEFEESRAVNVVLALDLHVGSNVGDGDQTTLEYLVRAAASLAQQGIRQGASVRLVTGDLPSSADVASRGTEHLFAILADLAHAEATDPSPLEEKLVGRIGPLQPGTTLVVLTASSSVALADMLTHYTAYGTQVVVVFAEPSSFVNIGAPMAQSSNAFVERLSGARAIPVLLRLHEHGQLEPEIMRDANYAA